MIRKRYAKFDGIYEALNEALSIRGYKHDYDEKEDVCYRGTNSLYGSLIIASTTTKLIIIFKDVDVRIEERLEALIDKAILLASESKQ